MQGNKYLEKEGDFLSFFRKIKEKLIPPKASISLELEKWSFSPGETIQGNLVVRSDEEINATEIRCEIECVEEIKNRIREYDRSGKRIVEKEIWNRITHFSEKPAVCSSIRLRKGSMQTFLINLNLPVSAWLTCKEAGHRLTWKMKGVIAVDGRPDVTSKTIEIEVKEPQEIQQAYPQTTQVATSSRMKAAKIQHSQISPLPTNCTRCGAPITITQEDLIFTCRYCGFTMTLATREEIKRHSMLENHLFAQQAVEAARKYMDKGLLRVGVSKEAQIINVKLRYVPFWVFQANANTWFRGIAGTGIMGELHQAEEAVKDKRAGGFEKLGKIFFAGVKAYAEMQQKEKKPQTVSYSFTNSYIWPTLARRTLISEINNYDVPVSRKIPFDVGKIPSDAEFLNIELDEEEAKTKVKAEIEAKERLIALGKVDTLEKYKTNVVISEGELVHVPIWFIHYTLKGENYVIVVDGCEGKVLGGGRPLFKIV